MHFLGSVDIGGLIILLAVFLFSIACHESAHGYAAYLLGDPTAKMNDRISLNPIKHMDLWGTLAIILIGVGWAKPVPINPNNFQDRKKGIMLSSLAGPMANFALALMAGFLLSLSFYLNLPNLFKIIFSNFLYINTVLMVFNLIPIPPLDGAGILGYFIPQNLRVQWNKFQENGPIILIILVGIQYFFNINVFSTIIFYPARLIYEFILLISGLG